MLVYSKDGTQTYHSPMRFGHAGGNLSTPQFLYFFHKNKAFFVQLFKYFFKNIQKLI